MRTITTNLLNYFYKKGIKPLADQINNKFDKSKMLNTLEEIEANTRSEYGAGALVVKEINSNLSELGTVYNSFNIQNPSGTIINGNTYYSACNMVLQPGTYIIFGKINIKSLSEVSIIQRFYTDDGTEWGANSVITGQRYIDSIALITLTTAKTIYLQAYISSTSKPAGSILHREMYAIKLK